MTADSDRLADSDRSGARARLAISLIDLTDLADDHRADGIDELCRRAAEHGTAAVCVWPEFVGRCASALGGSDVRVATVVNFPSGDEDISDVVAATGAALAAGADDIDVVLPFRSFARGDADRARRLVSSVTSIVDAPRIVKVILETGALAAGDVGPAARLAIDHGADFIKTSTGKLPVGATPDAVTAMLAEIAASDRTVGLKPSGGIRSFEDADAYVSLAEAAMGAAWVSPKTFRFGASGLLDALLAVVDRRRDAGAAPDDSY